MMTCRDVQRNMSAYLDGEMDAPARDAFFDHLQDCPACCDAMGESVFQETLIAGALKQRMEAPAAIRYNVLSSLSAEKAREAARPVSVPVWQRLGWRPAAAFATVLALAGGGWRILNAPVAPELLRTAEVSPAPSSAPKRAAEKSRVAYATPAIRESAPAPRTEPARSEKPAIIARHPRISQPDQPERPLTTRPVPARREPAPKPSEHMTTRPAAPDLVAANPASEMVGTVREIRAPGNVLNGRFLSRAEGMDAWNEAPHDLRLRTHLQSAADTVVTMKLNDGTILKSNHDTEFVVLHSPTREDPSWGIRLVRGELWVKSDSPVDVTTPSMDVTTDAAEFSVRSMDGQDAAAIAVEGRLVCHNEYGSVDISDAQATSASAGAAPEDPFPVIGTDPETRQDGQLGWAYAPMPAHNPLNDGGTQF